MGQAFRKGEPIDVSEGRSAWKRVRAIAAGSLQEDEGSLQEDEGLVADGDDDKDASGAAGYLILKYNPAEHKVEIVQQSLPNPNAEFEDAHEEMMDHLKEMMQSANIPQSARNNGSLERKDLQDSSAVHPSEFLTCWVGLANGKTCCVTAMRPGQAALHRMFPDLDRNTRCGVVEKITRAADVICKEVKEKIFHAESENGIYLDLLEKQECEAESEMSILEILANQKKHVAEKKRGNKCRDFSDR